MRHPLPASVSIFTFFGNFGQVAYGQLAAFSTLHPTPVVLMYALITATSAAASPSARPSRADRRCVRMPGVHSMYMTRMGAVKRRTRHTRAAVPPVGYFCEKEE